MIEVYFYWITISWFIVYQMQLNSILFATPDTADELPSL